MTFGDIVTLVTTELGVYDDTSTSLAMSFLTKNYNQIWDKYPWGDANGYGTIQVAAGTATVDYPDLMDRIITVRATTNSTSSPPDEVPPEPDDVLAPPPAPALTDSHFLDPVDSTFLIESEPGIFEDRGLIRYYEETGSANQRQIRLYPIPNWGTTLLCYGKMMCGLGISPVTGFSSRIRNIDAALIAYTMADMLQRQRQYAKADLKRKEAVELEQVAWNLEQQQANLPRRTKATTVAGNSLAEMTDAVCTICGQWTPDYRLIIREFLRRNYQTLYDSFLWPESLVMVRVPFTTEQVVMPHYIDKVLGIRGASDMRMFPADAVLFLDITPSIFEEIGEPIAYTTLTPVAVSTLPASTQRLVFASTSGVDRSKLMVRGEVLSTGQELEETVTLNGTTPVYSTNYYDIPLTIAKDITLGDVTVNSASDSVSLEVLPAGVRELKHQRLWFLPAPNNETVISTTEGHLTCLVLGKRAIRPLIIDQDTPIITGAQQVLIAAAAADLFRKLEKHDLATAMLQKTDGSMKVLKDKNMDQAASSPRFVPQIEPRTYAADYGCVKW